jgi:hypothetical protein
VLTAFFGCRAFSGIVTHIEVLGVRIQIERHVELAI